VSLRLPASVLALSPEDLCVADTGHDRVLLASRRGGVRTLVGSDRIADPPLCHPRAIDVGPHGDVLVTDMNHHRVLRLAEDDKLQLVLGDGTCGNGSRLHWPRCARWGPDGTIVVADMGNHRIAFYGPNGRLVREL